MARSETSRAIFVGDIASPSCGTLLGWAIETSLSFTCVQFFNYQFQLLKLLPSLAKFALCRQALVVGKVFAGLHDECVEIRRLRRYKRYSRRLRCFRGVQG